MAGHKKSKELKQQQSLALQPPEPMDIDSMPMQHIPRRILRELTGWSTSIRKWQDLIETSEKLYGNSELTHAVQGNRDLGAALRNTSTLLMNAVHKESAVMISIANDVDTRTELIETQLELSETRDKFANFQRETDDKFASLQRQLDLFRGLQIESPPKGEGQLELSHAEESQAEESQAEEGGRQHRIFHCPDCNMPNPDAVGYDEQCRQCGNKARRAAWEEQKSQNRDDMMRNLKRKAGLLESDSSGSQSSSSPKRSKY
ncbi:hypothetical protein F4820DRAFT_443764 [Hypoxylon rubiginosum]|uniref:Uncharacterized protein n=1 Tax=Hypoxylon rubiginosum TaxID=110542 RepID=A0ACB9ZE79_9PEZI|nr:hypothetical protein F4820DRAFT_443764 [Hypoxylon rubiginosum]